MFIIIILSLLLISSYHRHRLYHYSEVMAVLQFKQLPYALRLNRPNQLQWEHRQL